MVIFAVKRSAGAGDVRFANGVEDSEQLSGRNYACDELGAPYEMESVDRLIRKIAKSYRFSSDRCWHFSDLA